MNRQLIRAISLVGLFIVLIGVGNAQTQQQYRAQVPFDFHVGNHVYNAGSYSVGPIHGNWSREPVGLIEKKTGRMRIIGIANSADDKRLGEKGKLIFFRLDGRWVLMEISTPTFALQVKRPPTDDRIARYRHSKPESVEINLN